MLLGGLWHGASWTFLIWGGIHGALLALERLKNQHLPAVRIPSPLATALTFLVGSLTWIFFRADSLADALTYLQSLAPNDNTSPNLALTSATIQTPYHLGSLLLASLIAFIAPQTWDWTRQISPLKVVAATACGVLALLLMATQDYNPFIYFIF
jgi:alginate O-acetyltransferase complex protein AlgI